ncbi:MAG: thioredoxin family protein [Bacteroidales bacterium]|nr:thioredoxin family protein [Bacteroidales bacterium]
MYHGYAAFVLLDIWGTWCAPCKEALSHSTEEYARLKDYDIEFLYLANQSPQESWENVIKEYNMSGPNVAHYNLPEEQQSAIERHLDVHSSTPTNSSTVKAICWTWK